MAGSLAACASIPADRGFGGVKAELNGRTAQRVHWRMGGDEDAKVDRAIAQLLADELTADEAVQVALLNNRRLQATYESLGLAQAELVQAGLLENPVFDAIAFFPEGGSEPGSPPVNWDLGLTQSFLSLVYRPLRKAIADAEFEAARLRVAAAVIDVAADTRQAYLRVVADQQIGELLKQVVAGTSASFEYAQALHDAGNISNLSLHREQAIAEEARLMFAEAQAQLVGDREALIRQLGVWGPMAALKLPTRLPELPDTAWMVGSPEAAALEASLELAAQQADLLALGRKAGMQDARGWLEDLELGVAVESEGNEWESGPILAFPVPLFDQGQARLEVARSNLRRAAHSYYATAVEVRSQARETVANVRSLRQRSSHLSQVVVPLRSRIVAEELLQYNAMQVGVIDVLTEQRRQINAGIDAVTTLRDYWMARAAAEQLMAGGNAGAMAMAGGEAPSADTPESGGH